MGKNPNWNKSRVRQGRVRTIDIANIVREFCCKAQQRNGQHLGVPWSRSIPPLYFYVLQF